MRKRISESALVLLLCSGMFSSLCTAGAASGDIQKALQGSSQFPKEQVFRVVADDTSARISTYLIKKNTESDKKIDAVMIARTVLDADSHICRVAIDFYDEPGKAIYAEVVITKPTMVAFASGQVTKEDLLASIAVENKVDQSLIEQEKQRLDAKEKGKEQQKATTEPPTKSTVSKAGNASPGYRRANAGAISFEYPAVWALSNDGHGDTLVEVESTRTTHYPADIEVKCYWSEDRRSVMDEARSRVQSHLSRCKNYVITRDSRIVKFGVGNALSGVDESFSHSDDGKPYFERHIYFGWPGCVYKIRYKCHRDDYHQVNAIFNRALATVKVERSPAANR